MHEKLVYSVAEVAAMLGLSRQTVTRLFESERGVLILGCPERMHKRGYRSIRIPRAIYERVVNRLMVKGARAPGNHYEPKDFTSFA
jgi:AcrR family transcriptional regulator